MNITLVYPGALAAPYSLLCLASILLKNGHAVKIADFTKEELTEENIISKIGMPDVIGITSYSTPMIARAVKITKVITKRKPNIFIIWGGIHATLFPKDVLDQLQVDAVCIGEGENTLLELVNNLQKGKPITKIKGLMFKKGKKYMFTGNRELIKDLNEIEYPRHLIDINKYIINDRFYGNCFYLIESRGCPFRCSFCITKVMFGRIYRGRMLSAIIKDIEYLVKKCKINMIWLYDDLPFGGDKKMFIEFCQAIKKFKIKWSCEYRVNLVDQELVAAMKDSGCTSIYFGVESYSEKMLKIMQKDINVEQINNALNLCFTNGIESIVGLMFGFPEETEEDLIKTIEMANKIGAPMYSFKKYVPYYGTSHFNVHKDKILLPTKIEDWAKFGVLGNFNYSLFNINEKKIKKYCRKLAFLALKNGIKYMIKHKTFAPDIIRNFKYLYTLGGKKAINSID